MKSPHTRSASISNAEDLNHNTHISTELGMQLTNDVKSSKMLQQGGFDIVANESDLVDDIVLHSPLVEDCKIYFSKFFDFAKSSTPPAALELPPVSQTIIETPPEVSTSENKQTSDLKPKILNFENFNFDLNIPKLSILDQTNTLTTPTNIPISSPTPPIFILHLNTLTPTPSPSPDTPPHTTQTSNTTFQGQMNIKMNKNYSASDPPAGAQTGALTPKANSLRIVRKQFVPAKYDSRATKSENALFIRPRTVSKSDVRLEHSSKVSSTDATVILVNEADSATSASAKSVVQTNKNVEEKMVTTITTTGGTANNKLNTQKIAPTTRGLEDIEESPDLEEVELDPQIEVNLNGDSQENGANISSPSTCSDNNENVGAESDSHESDRISGDHSPNPKDRKKRTRDDRSATNSLKNRQTGAQKCAKLQPHAKPTQSDSANNNNYNNDSETENEKKQSESDNDTAHPYNGPQGTQNMLYSFWQLSEKSWRYNALKVDKMALKALSRGKFWIKQKDFQYLYPKW